MASYCTTTLIRAARRIAEQRAREQASLPTPAPQPSALDLDPDPEPSAPLRVLCLFAEPESLMDGLPLALRREQEVLRELLAGSPHVDATFRLAATPGHIHEALLAKEYDLIHLSGHSDGRVLWLEDGRGGAEPLPTRALLELIAARPQVDCLLLNACNSFASLRRGAPLHHVIGIDGEVYDDVALAFTRAFYRALAHGLDVPRAFQDARCLTQERFHRSNARPHLLTHPEVRGRRS